VAQTRSALARLEEILPAFSFETVLVSTPGDRDRKTDLRDTPVDFFTRDLDSRILSGELDCALHSAKDLPDPLPDGLDWCWLPWREDPRDAVLLRRGSSAAELPEHPRIAVSSERREEFCRHRFPGAMMAPIRGNIEERLDQLDSGDFDVVIMASAALARLGLADRISELISLEDLATPDGQGYLALTFASGNGCFIELRSLLTKSVAFAGAGVGEDGFITVEGASALDRCDVCIHDWLIPQSLLRRLRPNATRICVGKRAGKHSAQQRDISEMIANQARRGMRVVRLKGGDPGIYGRLSEEVEVLEELRLPYRVIPGVSSLNVATSGTGVLLTRRGLSRGFSVMTPRKEGGGFGAVDSKARVKLPVVLLMGARAVDAVVEQFTNEGMPGNTPVAMIFDAGDESESIVQSELQSIQALLKPLPQAASSPGILIVGDVARYAFDKSLGALGGQRVLLTCSDALQSAAAGFVHDYGGVPIKRPLIRLAPVEDLDGRLAGLEEYDWIAITSPSAVRCFMDVIERLHLDVRSLPRLVVSGKGTAGELARRHLLADLMPERGFSAAGILGVAAGHIGAGQRVMRLRSDVAGPDLAEGFRAMGASVEDVVLYRNETISYDEPPTFDSAFFASSSAVHAFVNQWGREPLNAGRTVAIGRPTADALASHAVPDVLLADEATVEAGIRELARASVVDRLEELL